MAVLGKWITNGTAAPFYARREFTVQKEIRKAEAKACGLGQFLFWVNGKKVGDHELDPGWTDYRKLVEYVSFDVTEYLHTGKNVIGAEVGNGWFIKMDEHYTFAFPPFMPPNPNPYRPYGKSLVFALELTVVYTDGTKETITADSHFTVKGHPVVMSNVYGSETMDGRMVQDGWHSVGFDDSDWKPAQTADQDSIPEGKLIRQEHPPVKVIHTYGGKYLQTVSGRDIYDFGQNMSGLLEFEVKGHAGEAVRIYPAEKLADNGDVDQMAKNWIAVDSCITYILGKDGEWEHFRMKFTYFAGRYVAVERVSKEKTERDGNPAQKITSIEIRCLQAHALSSAYQTDGTFTCDDVRYNQIYDMIEKTVEANMTAGVHTDCPTIERFAWQEPNHLMAPSIFFMKNGKRLWEKFLLDMRAGQHTAEDWFLDMEGGKFYPGEGLVPAQCPCYIPNVLPVPGMGSFYDIIPWGSTIILGTYWHYQFYGDAKVIADNYGAGMRYLEHLKTKVNADGFLNHGLGDWGNPRDELARENIETAFLYADAMTLAGFAKVLRKEADQKALEEYAAQVKENYNEKLLVRHPEKGFWCYKAWDHPEEIFLTQATEALPLYWGLVPEGQEEEITRALRYTLERDGAFISGEVGLPYVIQSARRYGMNDLVSRFILKKEHPSYYAFVLDGETTLGEYWETNPRSHCHDMMGHIIEWYYNGIAGILCEEPGFAKVTIRPYLPEGITEFDCSYVSVQGKIRVHVKKEGTVVRLEAEWPEQIACQIDTSLLEQGGCTVEVKVG